MRGGLLGRARLTVEPIAATAVLVLIAWLAVADPAAPAPPSCTRVADSVSGSDQNDGSSGAPWRTAQKLVDNLAPGQTGCLRAGRYREDVTVSHSGTADQRITIRSEPGQVATIEGRVLVTADKVTLSQLVLDAHLATGGYGQVVEGDDVVFSDNNVTSGATASCFKVGNPGAGRAFRLQILRSRIHNCKTGVLVSAATHTAVLRNLIYDNVDRGVRLEPDATGGTVMRNVIDNNGEGVFFGGGATTAPTSNVIHRNVIANSNARWNIGSSFPSGPAEAYNHVWKNCLYATNPDTSFNTMGGIVTPSPTRGFAVYDPYLVTGDPQYENRDAGDFHLKTESPCLSLSGDVAGHLQGSQAAPPDSAVPLRKPNVLIFLTDDQRSEGTVEVMPKMKKWFLSGGSDGGDLTAGGTWFPQAIGTTPLCCPGRTSLFSGLYSHNTLIEHNCCVRDVYDQGRTVQAYLGRPEAGYDRGIFGRFMNWNTWLNPPFFDKWAIAHAGNYFAPDTNEQGVRKGGGFAPRQYSTSYFRDRATNFLDEQEQADSKPWLLHVAPYAPHLPATPDTQYDASNYPQSELPAYQQTPAQLETDRSDKPPWVQQWSVDQNVFGTNPEGTRLRQLRTLKSVDDAVDDILTKLEQSGEAADTLAFFTSDNGYLWQDHGLTNKSKPYLDSVRVPFFMRWPANPKVRRNATDPRLVANIDVAPTVMDAAGVTPDPGKPMDGVSLLDRTQQRDRMLAEYWGDLNNAPDEETGVSSFAGEAGAQGLPKWKVPPWASTITRDYHYTEYYDDEGTQPTFREFYDLRPGHDPYELTNLYGSDGDPSNDPATMPSAATLSAQLARDRLCTGAQCPPGPGAPSVTSTRPAKAVPAAARRGRRDQQGHRHQAQHLGQPRRAKRQLQARRRRAGS